MDNWLINITDLDTWEQYSSRTLAFEMKFLIWQRSFSCGMETAYRNHDGMARGRREKREWIEVCGIRDDVIINCLTIWKYSSFPWPARQLSTELSLNGNEVVLKVWDDITIQINVERSLKRTSRREKSYRHAHAHIRKHIRGSLCHLATLIGNCQLVWATLTCLRALFTRPTPIFIMPRRTYNKLWELKYPLLITLFGKHGKFYYWNILNNIEEPRPSPKHNMEKHWPLMAESKAEANFSIFINL